METGRQVFNRLLKENRVILMLFTGEDERTFACYKPSENVLNESLINLQKQAKEMGKIVMLDLCLMDEDDFEEIAPREPLFEQ